MKLGKIAVAVMALAVLVVAASPMQSQPTKAFASELTLEKQYAPSVDYCVQSCNTYPNGKHYCGLGGMQIGCHHVNLSNDCIFWLCEGGGPQE